MNKLKPTDPANPVDLSPSTALPMSSEASLRGLVENSPDVIMRFDRSGRHLFVSNAVRGVTGLAPESFVGRTHRELGFPAEMCARWEDAIAEVFRVGAMLETQFEFTGPRGRIVFDWRLVPEHDEHGEVVSVLSIARDVTEQEESRANQRLALNVLQLLSHSGDTTLVIRDLLRLIRQRTGIEAAGVRVREGDDFPYCAYSGFSDSFIRHENYLCVRNGDGSPVRDEGGNQILECVCGLVLSMRVGQKNPLISDGGSFWTNESSKLLELKECDDPRRNPRNRCIAEGYESLAIIPLRSGAEVVGLLHLGDSRYGFFTPATIQFFEGLGASVGIALRRKQTEQALRESEAKHRRLLERLKGHYFLYRHDVNGVFTYLSETVADILGYSPNEFMTHYTQYLTGHPVNREADRSNELTIKGVQQLPHVVQVRHKDGSVRWLEVQETPVVDEDGVVIGVDGVAQDVTERKRAEDRSVRSAKLAVLGVLAAGMAHEINNPNASVMLNSSFLQDQFKSIVLVLRESRQAGILPSGVGGGEDFEKEVHDALNAIVQGSERIRLIVSELSEFVREGRTPLPEPVDVNKVVNSSVTLTWSRVKNATAEFSFEAGADLPTVIGSFRQLEQAVVNLLLNAADALTEKTQSIVVTTLHDAARDAVIIRIRDEGTGMSEETLRNIGTPFFTTRGQDAHIGLGISISIRVIERHGGTLKFESVPGGGTTVTVTLPLRGKVEGAYESAEPVADC